MTRGGDSKSARLRTLLHKLAWLADMPTHLKSPESQERPPESDDDAGRVRPSLIDFERPETWDFLLETARYPKNQIGEHLDIIDGTLQHSMQMADEIKSRFCENVFHLDPWIKTKLRSRADAWRAMKFRVVAPRRDGETTGTPRDIMPENEGAGGQSGKTSGYSYWEAPDASGGESDVDSLFGEPNSLFETPPKPTTGYIALSYCWPNGSWGVAQNLHERPTARGFGQVECPTSPAMWRALLAERTDDAPHVWFDQGCINQEDDVEKANTIACMDIIYKNAAVVVVALEDVVLSCDERDCLVEFGRQLKAVPLASRVAWARWTLQHEYIAQIAKICTKIEKARWMRRAWCYHECQVSRCLRFLVSVSGSDGAVEDFVEILKFDARLYLTIHWVKLYHTQNPGKGAKAPMHIAMSNLLFDNQTFGITQVWKEGLTGAARAEPNAMTDELADILAFRAGSEEDKLSIFLNIVRTGLSVRPGVKLNTAEVAWIGNMIAIASGDYSPLTSSGSLDPWRTTGVEDHSFAQLAWTTVPTRDAKFRRHQGFLSTLSHRGNTVRVVPGGVEMAVISLADSTDLHLLDTATRQVSEELINSYFSCQVPTEDGIYQKQPERLFTFLQEAGGIPIPELLLERLVECVGWTLRHGPGVIAHHAPFLEWGVSQSIVTDLLALLLVNENKTGTWNETWPSAQLDVLIHFAERMAWAACGAFSQYLSNTAREDWSIQMCTKDKWVDLIFAPQHDPARRFILAYPMALRDIEQTGTNSNRIWILKPKEKRSGGVVDDRDRYQLLGKSNWLGRQSLHVPEVPERSPPYLTRVVISG